MTFTGRPGTPAVSSWDGGQIDLFARAPNDTLAHWTWADGALRAKNLGGRLAGDPVVVRRSAERMDVFARGVGGWLLHWWWDDENRRMAGPETRTGWRLVRDPVAIATSAHRIDVFAWGASDVLRRWWTIGNDWFGPTREGACTSRPALVSRETGQVDVFGTFNGELWRRTWDSDESVRLPAHHHPRPGEMVSSAPVAASWSADRIDVFACSLDGSLVHWGWAGTREQWDAAGERHIGKWFGPEGSAEGHFTSPPVVITQGPDDLQLFALSDDRHVRHWRWIVNGPASGWSEPSVFDGPAVSTPAVLPLADRVEVFAWSIEDVGLWQWTADAGGSYAGLRHDLTFPEAEGKVESRWPSAIVPRPTHLLRRARDMVVLGVAWSGFRLVADTTPAALEPVSADARLVITFPPQHTGEEVLAKDGTAVPTIDPALTDGRPMWRAWSSGPSRVVFGLRQGRQRIGLTADGLLAALRGAPVLPGTAEPSDGATALELPWRLVMSPSGNPVSDHASTPVDGLSGAVGIWRARLHSAKDGTELSLVAHDAGPGADPIEVPLTSTSRQLIVAQADPARIRRLDLTALGGTLTARGRWPSFEWDHDAVLGRDQHVRTALVGMLYPFGQRVHIVEVTERKIDWTTGEPIAVLRKDRLLTLIDQTDLPADEQSTRMFPFSTIELTADTFVIDDPDLEMVRYPRKARVPDELQEELDRLRAELYDLPTPPGDWVSGPPSMEVLVDALEDFYADGGGPGEQGEETAITQSGIAVRALQLLESIQATEEHIAAIRDARAQHVPCHVWPKRDGKHLRFPMRCFSHGAEIVFDLPMIFVADLDLPETATMTSFDSLTDLRVINAVTTAFAELGAGVIEVAETGIQLVPGEVTMVRGLNIAGAWVGRGFHPRLGPAPRSAGSHLPAAAVKVDEWAAKVSLPALRTLLPGRPEAHEAAVRFSANYEAGVPERVPLRVVGNGIDINFSKDADRSGGLISPVIKATGLSGADGPVNVDGLASLAPSDLFTAEAKVLGFPLVELIGSVPSAPKIVTDLATGHPPVVRMEWEDIPLTSKPPFEALVGAKLTLSVLSSPASTHIECRISNFAMAFPKQSPLLRLSFTEVVYCQATGAPPKLTIAGLAADFLGELELLSLLQKKVGLGEAAPVIEAASDKIVARYALPVPDVRSGAFVMRNLTFAAAITVPFQGDPVTVALGFASREKPFLLTVLMFGGGGYVDIEFAHSGLRRLEVSLEFGAAVSVDFLIASGEAHVLGGIRFELTDGAVKLTGYLRIGGSVEVLGLVSVAVELVLSLGYQTTGNRLVGRATLVIELDLTLYSDTLELDSGEWVIAGDDEPAVQAAGSKAMEGDAGPTAADWDDYRRGFG